MKNKIKVIIAFIILLCSNTGKLLAQSLKAGGNASLKSIADTSNPGKQAQNIIRTANDLKSGNWQDVLSSFLQLSASDLTGASKALNFKSTLFALKAKADSSLLIDTNYVKQKFARNFQFDFSLHLDSTYKFTGFQGGFTWAIINKRDSSVVSFVHTLIDSLYLLSVTDLHFAFKAFQKSMEISPDTIDPKKLSLFKSITQKIEDAAVSGPFVLSSFFPVEFQPFLKPFVEKGFDERLGKADSLYKLKLEELRRKPLLTLSVNSTFKNQQQAFNNGDAQLIFLQGVDKKRSSTEIDLRAYANIRDTTVVAKERRADVKLSAGINFSLFQGKSHKSVFEFKPYLEFKNIITSPIGAEKKNVFTANADVRLRITDKLWLPVTIKYDFNKKNFLGFLNIAFNFNSFKKQL